MSIFITTSPPSEGEERGAQTDSIKKPTRKTEGGCTSLPPMHIIPSTRGEGISGERTISLKYQNKEHMKGRKGIKKGGKLITRKWKRHIAEEGCEAVKGMRNAGC